MQFKKNYRWNSRNCSYFGYNIIHLLKKKKTPPDSGNFGYIVSLWPEESGRSFEYWNTIVANKRLYYLYTAIS